MVSHGRDGKQTGDGVRNEPAEGEKPRRKGGRPPGLKAQGIAKACGLTASEAERRFSIPANTWKSWNSGQAGVKDKDLFEKLAKEPEVSDKAFFHLLALNPQWLSQKVLRVPMGDGQTRILVPDIELTKRIADRDRKRREEDALLAWHAREKALEEARRYEAEQAPKTT